MKKYTYRFFHLKIHANSKYYYKVYIFDKKNELFKFTRTSYNSFMAYTVMQGPSKGTYTVLQGQSKSKGTGKYKLGNTFFYKKDIDLDTLGHEIEHMIIGYYYCLEKEINLNVKVLNKNTIIANDKEERMTEMNGYMIKHMVRNILKLYKNTGIIPPLF